MIAVQLAYPETILGAVAKYGCIKIEQVDPELALWKTPWDFYFTVPELGPDKMCPMAALYEILADIERTRPSTH